jgi:deoxyribose-phosphate aldolase
MQLNHHDIAKKIDHALLSPSLTIDQLEAGIQMALQQNVASVCILPFYLKRCAELLNGSDVKAGTTIGFPHGGHSATTKIAEALQAISEGAQELDFVINISEALSGHWEEVRSEIKAMIDVTHDAGQKVKIIFENCYLNQEQKIRLCEISSELKPDWVKTSTGFGSSGATIDDIKLMREYCLPEIQIKAAGGIRDLEALLAFCAAGATRIGTSRTWEILQGITESKRFRPSGA